jgi:cell wall-associated NlpC family hydrolase
MNLSPFLSFNPNFNFSIIIMSSFKPIYILFPVCLFLACGPAKNIQQFQGGDIVLGPRVEPPVPAPAPASTSESQASQSSSVTDSGQLRYNAAIQVRYAGYLKIEPQQIQNIKLYSFIDQWMATPYKWGGTDASGIDCSAFIQRALAEVYSIQIPRTSVQQFFNDWIDKFGSTEYLSEGDLVFFRTDNEKLISHVGMYLKNRMFVNSSSSKGVSIGCLDDPYWKRCYVAAGRIKIPPSSVQK